jgi:hypothetical protein
MWRAATVLEPGRFSTPSNDAHFYSVGVGKRADLPLADGDPRMGVEVQSRIYSAPEGGVPPGREAINGVQ